MSVGQEQINYGEMAEKAYDSIDDKTKLEGFKSLVEELDESKTIEKLKNMWEKMTENQKMELYKRDAFTLKERIKHASPIVSVTRDVYTGAKNISKYGMKNAGNYSLLENIPCRFLVELSILKKPDNISYEKIIEDAKKDTKNFDTYLGIAEGVCAAVPGAQEAIPFIGKARNYVKSYDQVCMPVIQERLTQNMKKETEKNVVVGLSSVEGDIIRQDISNKAAN